MIETLYHFWTYVKKMCSKKIVLKKFAEGGGVGNITDPEGGPTATGMIPEGGTTEKKFPSTLHRLINGTALKRKIRRKKRRGK